MYENEVLNFLNAWLGNILCTGIVIVFIVMWFRSDHDGIHIELGEKD